MPKMSANVYVIEDYENETAFRPKKTNPNKPNFKRDDGFSPQGVPGTAHYTRDCHGPQISCLPLRLSSLAPAVTRVQAQDEAAGESKMGASQ